jgi:hypothetical protein
MNNDKLKDAIDDFAEKVDKYVEYTETQIERWQYFVDPETGLSCIKIIREDELDK